MPTYQVSTAVMVQPDPAVIDAAIADAQRRLDEFGIRPSRPITGGILLNLDAEFDVPADEDAASCIAGQLRELGMGAIMPLFPKLTGGSLRDRWAGQMPDGADPRRLSRRELCHTINKGPATVGRLTQQEGMPHTKDGHLYFYDLDEVAAWAAGRWDF